MFEPIVTFFDKLVENFTWSRLVFVFGLLALFIFGLLVFENYTRHFELSKLSREIDLLADAAELANKAELKEEKNAIRDGLKNVLAAFNSRYQSNASFQLNRTLPNQLTRILLNALPWALLLLVIMLTTPEKDRGSAIAGVIFFATPFIVIGTIFIKTEMPWLNELVYPWMTMISTVLVVLWWHKRKKRSTSKNL